MSWRRLMESFMLSQLMLGGLATRDNFDFVVIGGGTAGLVIANRLTEIANITVAVIEVGDDQRNNPNVSSVNSFPLGFDTPVDWQYVSTAQTYGDDRVLEYHAGKAIGGSSTINGMTYVRAQKPQIDAWETLGAEGWNWDSMMPYYKKSENFIPPTPAQVKAGAKFDPEYHGRGGPISVAFPYELTNGTFYNDSLAGWTALGQPLDPDASSGNVHGFDVWPKTCIPNAELRDDAARAYYYPIEGRPNLSLFKGTATQILWDEDSAIATGVKYSTPNGTYKTLQASREVILSAGSLRTPAVLELSGVGNPAILGQFNISTKVSLPSVGENLLDQPNGALYYGSTINVTGFAPYATFATAKDIFGSNYTSIKASVESHLSTWATTISDSSNGALNVSSVEEILRIQYNLLFNQMVPNTETIATASAYTLLSAIVPTVPFSRGSVHIQSANPTEQPAINPNFFQIDFDMQMFVALAQFSSRFWSTPPMAARINQTSPTTLSTPPFNATDADWEAYLLDSFSTNYHPMGTAAMMSKDLGGVVDANLKVYGTENVRVIDASVFPMQISGHLTSTLYALSEKAADIIKAGL